MYIGNSSLKCVSNRPNPFVQGRVNQTTLHSVILYTFMSHELFTDQELKQMCCHTTCYVVEEQCQSLVSLGQSGRAV